MKLCSSRPMKSMMAGMLMNIRRYNLNSQKIRLLILMLLALTTAGCSYAVTQTNADPFALPRDYISQERIVLQGFSSVPTRHGDKTAVYFGYDRDRQFAIHSDNAKVAVDLVEFKMVETDGAWRWEPFAVISDDDFDGYADRLFLDADFDGTLESIFNICNEKLAIDKIGFKEINPWLLTEGSAGKK